MVQKLGPSLGICLLLFWCLPLSVVAAADAPALVGQQAQSEPQGAKRLSPVLDLFGEELNRMGTKLMDNVVYSMQELWQDTLNWDISKKTKI
ncbi:MAG: hypothetical protein M0Z55_04510 [Peptococcaceae bacterium]|nr:hypothetical protein [Peptococcaceae bacterium]